MRLALLIPASLAIALTHSVAFALPITITGYDGTTTITNTAASPTTYSNSVGNWSALGSAQGTPPLPLGDLFSNTVSFNTDGPGTFTLWVTENGLTDPTGVTTFLSSLTTNLLFGGVTSVTGTTSIQFDNSTPGPLVPLGTILDSATFLTANQAQTGLDTVDIPAGPFSLTEKYVIVATGPGGANLTIDLAAEVPGPATLALLGVGLLGLAAVRRRPSTDTNNQGDVSFPS